MPVTTSDLYTPQAISFSPSGSMPKSIVALPGGGVATGWISDLGGNVSAMFLDSYSGQGAGTGSVALVGYTDVDLAVLSDGFLAVAAIEDDELSIWKSNTAFNGGTPVNQINDGGILNLSVAALPSGTYASVLEDIDAGNRNIELRVFNTQNQQTTHLTVAGSAFNESDPQILSFDDGSFVVVWVLNTVNGTEIWRKHYDANGAQTGPAALFTAANMVSDSPMLARTDTGFALAWEQDSNGPNNISFASFSSSGTVLSVGEVTPSVTVASTNPTLVTLPNGELALIYQTTQGGQNVLATRMIDPANPTTSAPTHTVTATTATIDNPVATLAEDGHLWLAWSETQGGTTTARTAVVTPGLRHTIEGGSETVEAGALNEDFVGDSGLADIADYSRSPEAVVTGLDLIGSGGFARGDSYTDMEGIIGSAFDDNLSGNAEANQLRGGAGNDTLVGNDGADLLDGGAGADTMQGGTGDDFYLVDDAGDVVSGEIGFSSGGGIDTIRAFVDYTQPDNVELLRLGNLTDTTNLSGTGNDGPGTLVGNAGNNILTGRGGNDQINGNDGNDRLIGNTGRDTLVGGAGADTFVLTAIADSRAGSTSRDFINGFTHGQDRIDLSGIDANRFVAGHQSWDFIGNAAFDGDGSASAGQLRYFTFGGGNYNIVEADLNGDGTANLQLFVNLTNWMTGSDFIL